MNPIRIRNEEASIHLEPTLSACFSASRDQWDVPKRISPILVMEGVDERKIVTPSKSPVPPSRKSIRTREGRGTNPKAIRRPNASASAITDGYRRVLPTVLRALCSGL